MKREVVRSYKLKLYPNKHKYDTACYTIKRFNEYTNLFIGKAFYSQSISTKGMGDLANQAAHRACDITRRHRKAGLLTGDKMNIPYTGIIRKEST